MELEIQERDVNNKNEIDEEERDTNLLLKIYVISF